MAYYSTVPCYTPLFTAKNKYIILSGGRDSGKSNAVYHRVVTAMLEHVNHDIIICRSNENSTSDSSYAEIETAIRDMDLADEFIFQKSPMRIKRRDNHGTIYFKGIGGPDLSRTRSMKTSTYDIEPCKNVMQQIEKAKKFAKDHPGGGTLLLSGNKVVKMRTGYQFSFKRPIQELDLTSEEFDEISNWIMKKTGSRLFVGFWGGSGENDPPDTEPSFWTDDEDVAMEIALLFNQKSILNWGALNNNLDEDEIFKKNYSYKESKPQHSKEEILEIIRKESAK